MCRPSTPASTSSSNNLNNMDFFSTPYITKTLVNLPKPIGSLVRKSSTDKTKTPLPLDFEPSEYSVICGNKKKFFNSVGNRRFRLLCQMHLDEFMNSHSKHEKSFVVSKVMNALRDACPIGAFVAFEKGQWWEVSDRTSREKVGTFFRDCCADKYKSSSKNKIAERRKKRTMVFDPTTVTEDNNDTKNNNRCVSPIPSATTTNSVVTPLAHPMTPPPSSSKRVLTTTSAAPVTPIPSAPRPIRTHLTNETENDTPLKFVEISNAPFDPLDIDDESSSVFDDEDALNVLFTATGTNNTDAMIPTEIAVSNQVPLETYDDEDNSRSVEPAAVESFSPVDAFIYSFFD